MSQSAYNVTGRLVLLGMQDDLYLIVLGPTGVFYSNQAGGVSCDQPAEEGILVPLGHSAPDVWSKIQQRIGGAYGNVGASSLTATDAEAIDGILSSSPYTSMLSVDRARLRDSQEAWVYVDIAAHADRYDPNDVTKRDQAFFGFERSKGVLTWQNSD